MKALLMEGNGVTYGRDKRFFPAIRMLLLAVFFAGTSIFAYGGPPPAYTPKIPGRIRFALCQTATAKPDGTNVVNRVFDWIRRKNLDGVDVFILPELAFAKVGLLICKDAFFPNVGSEAYADADIIVTQFAHPGVDINTAREARFFPPTAWALSELRDSSAGWRRFRKPFLAVNKVGRDGPYNLVGGSHVADANGRRGAELGSGPGVLLVDFPLRPDGRIEAKPTGAQQQKECGIFRQVAVNRRWKRSKNGLACKNQGVVRWRPSTRKSRAIR